MVSYEWRLFKYMQHYNIGLKYLSIRFFFYLKLPTVKIYHWFIIWIQSNMLHVCSASCSLNNSTPSNLFYNDLFRIFAFDIQSCVPKLQIYNKIYRPLNLCCMVLNLLKYIYNWLHIWYYKISLYSWIIRIIILAL